MNKIFKVIWNAATQSFVVVSELTRSRGKSSSKSTVDERGTVALGAVAGAALIGGMALMTANPAFADITTNAENNSNTGDSIIYGNVTVVLMDNLIGDDYSAKAKQNLASIDPLNKTTAVGKDIRFMPSGAGNFFGVGLTNLNSATVVGRAIDIGAGKDISLVGNNITARPGSGLTGTNSITGMGNHISIGNTPSSSAGVTAVGNNLTLHTGTFAVGNNITFSNNPTGAIAAGENITLKNQYALAYGRGITDGSINSTSFGNNLTIGGYAGKSVVLGQDMNISLANGGARTIAVGGNIVTESAANDNNSDRVLIGQDIKSFGGSNQVIIGKSANATGGTAIAIGFKASTQQKDSLAVGPVALSNGVGSGAFGLYTNATGTETLAVGAYANASQAQATAIGARANARGSQTIAVGNNSNASGEQAISIGNSSVALGNLTIAMGNNSNASGRQSIAIGNASNTTGNLFIL